MPRKKSVSFQPIDIHIGAKTRSLRAMRRFTQADLADRLNLSFQQIQKYENGANRISAGNIFRISKILGVSLSYFFEGLEAIEGDEAVEVSPVDLKAVRAAAVIAKISDEETRNRLCDLIKAMASNQPSGMP